jgi:hypothetical protein
MVDVGIVHLLWRAHRPTSSAAVVTTAGVGTDSSSRRPVCSLKNIIFLRYRAYLIIIHKDLLSIPTQLQGLDCDGGDRYAMQSHHIFPQAQLERAGYDSRNNHHDKKRVNEITNRVPLTHSVHLDIFDS